MKKIILSIVMVCVMMGISKENGELSQIIRLSGNLSYNMLNMAQLNSQLNRGIEVTTMDTGISAMVDANLIVTPSIMIGARTGYLYCLPGNSTLDYLLFKQKTTVNASLVPVELGFSINFELPEMPISLLAGIYAGYGFASASVQTEIVPIIGPTATILQPYAGRGYVGEAIVSLDVKLNPVMSINVNGGYRVAKIAKVEQTKEVAFNGIPFVAIPVGSEGEVYKDSDDKEMMFDFSGLNIGVGISLCF